MEQSDPTAFLSVSSVVQRSFLCTLFLAALVYASPALEVSHHLAAKKRVTVIRVRLPQDRLQLFWGDDQQQPLKSFAELDRWLARSGQHLQFAMNAGMFKPDLSPVGLCVIGRHELTPLNLRDGAGNFFLKPNGVFLLTTNGAQVVESSRYREMRGAVEFATQSGPLLLRKGGLHPAFRPDSNSRYLRNGVGLRDPHTVLFAITEDPVSFHEFAVFFRDTLGCPDALYLDGAISSLYLADANRSDVRGELGPMFGISKGPGRTGSPSR